jgi:hypothetical protein
MGTGIAVAGGAGFLITILGLTWYRLRRLRLYRKLAAERAAMIEQSAPPVSIPSETVLRMAEEFSRERLVRDDDFLSPAVLEELRQEALANVGRLERSYIPAHKKGGALAYEKIHYHAPKCLGLYHSPVMIESVSRIVGVPVVPTADHDQSSCSILYYQEAGDHINWHFDLNFYKGRHFTVLVSLFNQGAGGGVSDSRLYGKTLGGEERAVDSRENSLIVFEGAKIRHKVTPTKEGDLRVVLSMTYATDPRIGWFKELAPAAARNPIRPWIAILGLACDRAFTASSHRSATAARCPAPPVRPVRRSPRRRNKGPGS